MKKLKYLIKPPCPKCPYKQGFIKFEHFTEHEFCEMCKKNNYYIYESYRKRFGGDVLFTDKFEPQYQYNQCIGISFDCDQPFLEHKISPEKLLPGELVAFVLTVGCYSIRIARRFYKTQENDNCDNSVELPADEAEIAYIRETGEFSTHGRSLQIMYEISAKHNTDPNGVFAKKFKLICRTPIPDVWSDFKRVDYICTVKKSASVSDEQARLFIFTSLNCMTVPPEYEWYSLNAQGIVTYHKNNDIR